MNVASRNQNRLYVYGPGYASPPWEWRTSERTAASNSVRIRCSGTRRAAAPERALSQPATAPGRDVPRLFLSRGTRTTASRSPPVGIPYSAAAVAIPTLQRTPSRASSSKRRVWTSPAW